MSQNKYAASIREASAMSKRPVEARLAGNNTVPRPARTSYSISAILPSDSVERAATCVFSAIFVTVLGLFFLIPQQIFDVIDSVPWLSRLFPIIG